MEYSRRIARSLIDYHEKNRLNYEFNECESLFKIPMTMEDSKVKHISNKIKITENGYFCSSVADFYVETNERHKMLEHIRLINNELSNRFHLKDNDKIANFSFDFFSGEISYNQSKQCGNKYLSDEEIDDITSMASSCFYIFAEGFYSVLNSYETPEEAAISSLNRLDEVLSNATDSQNSTNPDLSEGYQEYDDYEHDGWGDLNPYDLDADDYEAWMDSFD